MFQAAMSNSTLSEEATLSSFNPLLLQNTSNVISPPPKKVKKKRSLPGNPDPDAEVIALSPKSLLATNRFICEICNKGFQRDQNLQLHRRGHNLPWKLKQRSNKDVVRKKAYVCPETSCIHHHPSRALGDLTGIKKHFCRKHGEKKYKCEKCSKIYAVQSDWKAHSKTCGTREYRCDCGTLFSRKDSFITHRAFCDALAEESGRLTNPFSNPMLPPPPQQPQQPPPPPFSTLPATSHNPSSLFPFSSSSSMPLSCSPWDPSPQNPNPNNNLMIHVKTENHHFSPPPPPFFQPPHIFTKGTLLTSPFTSDTTAFLSATSLLQKATSVGSTLQQAQAQQDQAMIMAGFDELGASFRHITPATTAEMAATTTTTTTTTNHDDEEYKSMGMTAESLAMWRKNEDFTRDFLGLTAGDHYTNPGNNCNDDEVVGDMIKFTGGLHYGMTAPYDRDNSSSSSSSMLFKPHHPLVHHHHQVDQSFGNFVTAQPTTAAAASSELRWG